MNTDLALRILKGSSSDFAHPLSLSLSYCILFRILYTDLFEKKKKKEESEKKNIRTKKYEIYSHFIRYIYAFNYKWAGNSVFHKQTHTHTCTRAKATLTAKQESEVESGAHVQI